MTHMKGTTEHLFLCPSSVLRLQGRSKSRTLRKIIGVILPDIPTAYTSCLMRRVKNILQDNLHPAHHLFQPMPSGRRYRSIRAKTSRLANSLHPHAVRLLNGQSAPPLPIGPLWYNCLQYTSSMTVTWTLQCCKTLNSPTPSRCINLFIYCTEHFTGYGESMGYWWDLWAVIMCKVLGDWFIDSWRLN